MGPLRVLAAGLCLAVAGCTSPSADTVDPPPTTTVAPAAPAVAVCGSNRDNAGVEFPVDPLERPSEEEMLAHCGTLASRDLVCPDGRERRGLEFTWDPDDESLPDAWGRHCGPVYETSWEVSSGADPLTDVAYTAARTKAVGHDVAWTPKGTPSLGVVCEDGFLRYEVWFGGDLVRDAWPTNRIQVLFRFDDGEPVQQQWDEVPTGEYVVAGPFFDPEYENLLAPGFLHGLRSSETLMFRAWNSDDTVAGTMTFDLAGVGRDVEPVLQECGY